MLLVCMSTKTVVQVYPPKLARFYFPASTVLRFTSFQTRYWIIFTIWGEIFWDEQIVWNGSDQLTSCCGLEYDQQV